MWAAFKHILKIQKLRRMERRNEKYTLKRQALIVKQRLLVPETEALRKEIETEGIV